MSIVTYVQGISEALRAFLETAYESASCMSTIAQCRGRHHIPDEDAGIARGQRRPGQIVPVRETLMEAPALPGFAG